MCWCATWAPRRILLSSGCKFPSQSVGQYKCLPVSYSWTPADIIIVLKPFLFIFSLFQWLVENWEKGYVRFYFENQEEWCVNNWYNIKIILFSLAVLENNSQKIKLWNTKSKFISSWFLKLWGICWTKFKRRINVV